MFFFFFKQKTAYEMRISDWSSDVCSSDLVWLPPKPERKTRHLTRPEFDRFLDGMVAPHARPYALIGLFTFARPVAILDLTWLRMDFMRGQIDLNPARRPHAVKRRPVVHIGGRLLTAFPERAEGHPSEVQSQKRITYAD